MVKPVPLVALIWFGITVVYLFTNYLFYNTSHDYWSKLTKLTAAHPEGKKEVVDFGIYPPVSCSSLKEQIRNDTLKDPNEGVMHGKYTVIEPRFWVSLHNVTYDRIRWNTIMKFGKYYEMDLQYAFNDILKDSPPGTRVIDVGANIGYFTLVSAARAPVIVDAFEPNHKNILRLCESLNVNEWPSSEAVETRENGVVRVEPKVNIYPYGIGRKEDWFMFYKMNKKPGQGVLTESKSNTGGGVLIRSITLDGFAEDRGWFESRPDIAILKVDVEGFETNVFAGAKKLIEAKIIRNIFMEVSARNKKEKLSNVDHFIHLWKSGYKVKKYGHWRGPNKAFEWPQDETLVENILNITARSDKKQLNLWWVDGRYS